MKNQAILIVEDNEGSVNLWRDVLGANGYRTLKTVTASAMPTDRAKIEGAGFSGYITKSISAKEFRAEVRQFVGEPGADGDSVGE